MAQLVKLKDYVSRYEWDMYRYPSQYIRLKQTNWRKLYDLWQHPDQSIPDGSPEDLRPSRFQRIKSLLKKSVQEAEETQPDEDVLPETEHGLKQYFLEKLFPFQLKWATSTVTDVSFMTKSFETDQTLQFFLQRFPDTYLLMYYPTFRLKKAPVDSDIILISPVGIDVIHIVEDEPGATIIAGNDRTWMIEKNEVQTNLLSPSISLKRTEQIINSVFRAHNVQFPVQKIVLSRTNNILFHQEPYRQKIIGKQEYEDWFMKKRNISSPLKSAQLKAAEVLLENCQTSSVRRPEWEEDISSFSIDQEEK